MPTATIRSVNVSMGREVPWRGKTIETGIFKEPVSRSVAVSDTGLEGDRQCDPRYHGGGDKAVYSYAWEHYLWWRQSVPELPGPAAFGENLTTEGMDEAGVCLGDRLRFGRALLEAAEPRMPCFKLGIRFGTQTIVKRFTQAGRWGVYWRVIEPGAVKAGDAIESVRRERRRVPLAALAEIASGGGDLKLARRALEIPSLSADWRAKMLKKLA